jgi:hypothetical protein
MKKWLWVPILVLLFFLFCCQKQDEVEQIDVPEEGSGGKMAAIAQTIANNLDSAVKNLEKGRVSEGAGLLLDSVLLVKPRDQWPEGFEDHIASAKANFKVGNLNDAVGDVRDALGLIKPPEKSAQTADAGEVAPLAVAMKGKITEAKESFAQGNASQGVIAILEALQLFAPQTK